MKKFYGDFFLGYLVLNVNITVLFKYNAQSILTENNRISKQKNDLSRIYRVFKGQIIIVCFWSNSVIFDRNLIFWVKIGLKLHLMYLLK